MISFVPLIVQSWYLVPIDHDALLVDLAVWRFRWSQTDVTSYRFGHYCLLVEGRSFTCTLGAVKAEYFLLCVADCRLAVATCLLLCEVEVSWVAHHPTATCGNSAKFRSAVSERQSRQQMNKLIVEFITRPAIQTSSCIHLINHNNQLKNQNNNKQTTSLRNWTRTCLSCYPSLLYPLFTHIWPHYYCRIVVILDLIYYGTLYDGYCGDQPRQSSDRTTVTSSCWSVCQSFHCASPERAVNSYVPWQAHSRCSIRI